jgi:hypothetical protein
MPPTTDSIANAPVSNLPDILFVMDGWLNVDTDDDPIAQTALSGFEYLLALEFARQHPQFALLYYLEFQVLEVRTGSREFHVKVWARLRKRVKTEIKKAGVITVLTAALAIPSAISDSVDAWQKLTRPVETQLCQQMPSTQITVNVIARAPTEEDVFDNTATKLYDFGNDVSD